MRDHPIPPVTEPFQYRAIGLVRGKYIPNDADSFSRGLIVDQKGEEIDDINIDFSFTGKSFDKSNTASGLILGDGRFVGDVPGKYIISARVGNVTTSKIVNIFPRNVKREIKKVGTGLVNDKHTSDFWVFEGVDGRDYAVTGTWGADGKAYFWDVTNPGNLKKIDSVLKHIDDLREDPLFIDKIHGEQELSLDQTIELLVGIRDHFVIDKKEKELPIGFESSSFDVS